LFGSSKNWLTNGKELTLYGRVLLLDLRNHGDSPHYPTHTLEDMVSDLFQFIETQKIESPVLIGHSMGGLISMLFCLYYPQIIHRLIVVDIAPKKYALNYEKEFSVLDTDLEPYNTRSQIDAVLEKIYPNQFIRNFLLMNLTRLENGKYRWKLNVPVLKNAKHSLEFECNENLKFMKKTLFIFGSISTYTADTDQSLIERYFSHYTIEKIESADHYLHYTHSEEFLQLVVHFLCGVD
jgi:esterase